ncbi:MAG: hypothetical protein BTN85_0753 [Candidatus Methanohalarchaeum thermophilum]|uniref:Uncharacterized protein n=1 Tax=Methanohalarchaeum thermophilum TaxID=1903181 RepID=A0A1Q6DV85_METT1|nr:MAG: hypothetical protein BTN85_0753 [Candidatus Methanohalarchaeum thermophilum]
MEELLENENEDESEEENVMFLQNFLGFDEVGGWYRVL